MDTAHSHSVVLVEGISDQVAVEALAVRLGRDLKAEGVAVGRRSADDSAFDPVTKWTPLPAPRDDEGPDYRELRVERIAGHWYAAFNNWPLGRWTDDAPAKPVEFRLRADGGEAHFTEIEVAPLSK